LGSATYYAQALGISADGAVVVGVTDHDGGSEQAFRWTEGSGTVGLGFLSGGGTPMSGARAVSADGEIVVGYSSSAAGGSPFMWTQVNGMQPLPVLPGTVGAEASAISPDGSIVIGRCYDGSRSQAFSWSTATGTVSLGQLAGGDDGSFALAVSANGVVVGTALQGSYSTGRRAFLAPPGEGMRLLSEVLLSQGVSGVDGWTLWEATGISSDGNKIVGWGVNPAGVYEAFIADFTPPDLVPDPFFFPDQTGVALSAPMTSAPVTITGITGTTPITVIGGQYSVGCGAVFTSAPGTISNSQTVCVRQTSAATNSTATNTLLTVGGVSDTFTSTTAGASGGGGGALDGFSLLALGLIGAMRRKISIKPHNPDYVEDLALSGRGSA
ncbi:MAG: GlyGly-CTERM sorting domain-containing protein, partial [Gammaproteobacteria bacterium]|nr:GlyGly-CTERM sorting domain-containing protein [Gammaproteobacteria bacterium]